MSGQKLTLYGHFWLEVSKSNMISNFPKLYILQVNTIVFEEKFMPVPNYRCFYEFLAKIYESSIFMKTKYKIVHIHVHFDVEWPCKLPGKISNDSPE